MPDTSTIRPPLPLLPTSCHPQENSTQEEFPSPPSQPPEMRHTRGSRMEQPSLADRYFAPAVAEGFVSTPEERMARVIWTDEALAQHTTAALWDHLEYRSILGTSRSPESSESTSSTDES
jgi:hypothetical protein